jgi:hypothetical protein
MPKDMSPESNSEFILSLPTPGGLEKETSSFVPKKFELAPPGSNPGTGSPLGGSEAGKMQQIGLGNQELSPELRERNERGGGLPIEAGDIIERVQSAEIGEDADITQLKKAIDKALAFKEGLELGPKGNAYEFNPYETSNNQDKQKIGYLQNMFLTVEGASDRPRNSTGYVDIAINNAIDMRIRQAQDWHDDPDEYILKLKSDYRKLNKALISRGQRPLDETLIESEIEEKRTAMENEFNAIAKLVELKNYVAARNTFDIAFQYRMSTCEDPKAAASLGGDTKTVTPDSPVWGAYFQGKETRDFGIQVNMVLEEIVKFGLPEEVVLRLGMEPITAEVRKHAPETIYADGFNSGVSFGVFVDHLLNKANGRMDIVWSAWKMVLTTEVLDTLGQKIDPKKGTYVLASPPIGNSLFTFINHLQEKRAIEFGLKADGTRNQTEIYISHAGLPMTLGMRPELDENGKPTGRKVPIVPNLCSDYLHESKIKFDRNGIIANQKLFETLIGNLPQEGNIDFNLNYQKLEKKLQDCYNQKAESVEVSLWDLWLYGRISFADPDFPWFQTDQPDADAVANELPSGSMGSWFSNRGRANGIVEDLKSQPTLGELSDPLFFVKRVRNWSKVLGKLEDSIRPEENPRNWWIMGILQLHMGVTGGNNPIVKKDPLRDFRFSNQKEEIEKQKEERATNSGQPSTGDVLANATRCGFIRPQDRKWIEQNLAI